MDKIFFDENIFGENIFGNNIFLERDLTFPPTPCYPPSTYKRNELTDRTDAMIVLFIVLDFAKIVLAKVLQKYFWLKYFWQKYFFLTLLPSIWEPYKQPHLISAPHQWFLKLSVTQQTKDSRSGRNTQWLFLLCRDRDHGAGLSSATR